MSEREKVPDTVSKTHGQGPSHTSKEEGTSVLQPRKWVLPPPPRSRLRVRPSQPGGTSTAETQAEKSAKPSWTSDRKVTNSW